MFVSHEINHARLFQKRGGRHGYARAKQIWIEEYSSKTAYAREEVLVQRTAEFQMRAVYEKNLLASDLEDWASALSFSRDLINRYMQQLK